MDRKQELLIVGAGGHAKVVLSTAIANGEAIIGYLDDNPDLLNQWIGQYRVLGNHHLLQSTHYHAIFGIGDNLVRKTIADHSRSFVRWHTLIHPHAYVHPSAIIGEGTVVFAGAIIQPDAVIGKHCIINTGASVDHDCILEDYVHIAPGVHLAGGVRIGEGALLGVGSVVIPNRQIHQWSTVAAGSVVVRDVPENATVMGVPAKLISSPVT